MMKKETESALGLLDIFYIFVLYFIMWGILGYVERKLELTIGTYWDYFVEHKYLFLTEEIIDAIYWMGIVYITLTKDLSMKLRDIGLVIRGNLKRNILLGVATGVGLTCVDQGLDSVISFFIKTEWISHPFTEEVKTIKNYRELLFILFAGVILTPFVEEVFFRGFCYKLLISRYNKKAVIIISSLLFALVHVNPQWYLQSFICGIIFMLLYLNTESLLGPIIAHSTVNLFALLCIYIKKSPF
jgi:membrane protease YdiL (CAAX protease family)